MKIGIDARFFGPIGKGLGRYTQKLIKNLELIDNKNQYVIFLRKENWDHYTPVNDNFKKVLADYRWYTLKEQIFIPLIIRKHNIDVMHFPHFNIPILYRGKFIATIHDLILIKYPTKKATTLDPIIYKLKYWGYKKVINSAVRRAEKIITVSNYTKNELVEYFRINENKVAVTYEACDGVESGQLMIPDRGFLKEYGINKQYLLYVGNAYPHKNLETLLDVFDEFAKKTNNKYQLVLVGKKDYFYERLIEYAKEKGLTKNLDVVFFGFATEKQLADLYRSALLYIFPSLFEGFGLPPLEAMSYGLPVLSSDASCLPEILGEAAKYFNPKDKEDILNKINLIIESYDLRTNLIEKGFKKIKSYSWEKCAQETLAVYNSIEK